MQKAALHDPNNFDIQYNLGFCQNHLGEPREAQASLQKALTIHPDSAAAKFQLMTAYRALGKNDLAQKLADELQVEKSATVGHDQGNVFGAKANELVNAGEYQKAIEQYRLALGADPHNPQTLYNLSVAQREAGDLAGEKSSLLQALKLSPDLALAHDAFGIIEVREGHLADGRRDFERGLEIDPQCASCKVHLGSALLTEGDRARGGALLRQAVEDDPQSYEAHRTFGMYLASTGLLPEARAQLKSAVALNPKDALALSDLGIVEGKLADPDAVTTLTSAVKLQPDSSEAHLNLGIALADQHRLDEALMEFSETVRLTPDDARGHYNKGRALTDLHRDPEAQSELEKACHLQPALPGACYDAAIAERKNGKLTEAAETLKKVSTSPSADADSLLLLGQTFQDLGQMPDAIEAWRKALELKPDSHEALYKLSRALEKSDPTASALYRERFKSEEDRAQVQNRASSLGRIALEASRAGNWPLAISDFDEALRVCGDCELAWQLRKDLGLSLCNSGDLTRGEKELRIDFEQNPNDPDIKYALALIDKSRAQPANGK